VETFLLDVAFKVVGLEGTGGFLHALHLLLLSLHADLSLYCHFFLLLALQYPSGLPELAIEGTYDIVN
jgi:hypothetical protein